MQQNPPNYGGLCPWSEAGQPAYYIQRNYNMKKILEFIAEHKRIFIHSASVALAAVVLLITVVVYNLNSRDDYNYKESNTGSLTETGYALGEFTLPYGFGELDFPKEPDDNSNPETDGNNEEDPDENGERPPRAPSRPIVSGLPAVHITTNTGRAITSRTTYIDASFSVDAPAGSGFQSFDSVPVRTRGRGNSTWLADKKPYRLNFPERVSFLGLPSGRQFVLLANAYDRSHIRNSVAFAAARPLSFSFVPTAIHVDLYVNGRYQGLYTIGDSVRPSSNGIGICRENGFLLELGGTKNDVHVQGVDFFHSHIQKHIRVRHPTPGNNLTRAQFNEISGYFQRACNAVRNLSNYEEHLDMTSIIDYFLLTELLYNLDGSFARSVFLMKNPGERIKIASVWDFDLAMGNYSADMNRYNVWASVHTEESWFKSPTWINYLIKDPAFQYAVRKRWEQVGDRIYNAARAEIRRNRNFLSDAVRKNNQVAPYKSNRFTASQTARIGSWNGQLDYIETFLRLRRNWMNNQISAFPASPPNGRDVTATTEPPIIVTEPPVEITEPPEIITEPPFEATEPPIATEHSTPTQTEVTEPPEPEPENEENHE
jgi:hypothetical protein